MIADDIDWMRDADMIYNQITHGDFPDLSLAQAAIVKLYVPDLTISRAGISHALKRLEKYYLRPDPWQDKPRWNPEQGGASYKIVDDGRAIYCRRCDKTSWNMGDVEHKFCVGCDNFHTER